MRPRFPARAEALLGRFEIARVAADPSPASGAGSPAGWTGMAYYRFHGSPRMSWSRYHGSYIDALAARIRVAPRSADVWSVFDNTASGAALENAWELQQALRACG